MSQPKNKNSVGYTLKIALFVCLVCAIVVSTAAVSLRGLQELNVELDMKRNILQAAGMLAPRSSAAEVEQAFEQVTTLVVDLRTGELVDHINPDEFNQLDAARDPSMSRALPRGQDPAGLGRQEHYSLVYLVGELDDIQQLILPIRGAALWSTLLGFIALESDLNTIAGLGFYSHQETPGLGGEIDNENWKAQWPGKSVFRDGEVAIRVTKGGQADTSSPYQIDGLSGATLTTRGVDELVRFWMGDNGFAPFLANLQQRSAAELSSVAEQEES